MEDRPKRFRLLHRTRGNGGLLAAGRPECLTTKLILARVRFREHRAAYCRIASTNLRSGRRGAHVRIAFQQRRKAPQPLSSDSSPPRGISTAIESLDRCDCGTPGGLSETEMTRNSRTNCRGRFKRLATRSTLVSCSAEFEGFDSVSLSVTDCVGANSGVPKLAGSNASSMARHASSSRC